MKVEKGSDEIIEDKNCCHKQTHRTKEEKKIVNDRLNRIEGQIKGIKKMIDLKEETAIENILINIKKNEKTLSWQEFNISKMRIQKRRTNIQRMNEIVYDLYD